MGQVVGGLDEVDGVTVGAQGVDDRIDGLLGVELRIPIERHAVPPRLPRMRCGGQIVDAAFEVVGQCDRVVVDRELAPLRPNSPVRTSAISRMCWMIR